MNCAKELLRNDCLSSPHPIPLPIRGEGIQIATPVSPKGAREFVGIFIVGNHLTTFHTDNPLETDFASLSRAARTIEVDSAQLRWHDWTRYSSRQSTFMQMGGLLGSVTLRGEGLAPFWPYLWLGQWTHAGKATSMGLGRYWIAATRQACHR